MFSFSITAVFFLLNFFLPFTLVCQRVHLCAKKNAITLTVTNFANKFVRAIPLSWTYTANFQVGIFRSASSLSVWMNMNINMNAIKMSRFFSNVVKWWDGCEELSHSWNECMHLYFSRERKKWDTTFTSVYPILCYAKIAKTHSKFYKQIFCCGMKIQNSMGFRYHLDKFFVL